MFIKIFGEAEVEVAINLTWAMACMCSTLSQRELAFRTPGRELWMCGMYFSWLGSGFGPKYKLIHLALCLF